MGSIISKIADEIELHGSWENYLAWRDQQEQERIDKVFDLKTPIALRVEFPVEMYGRPENTC